MSSMDGEPDPMVTTSDRNRLLQQLDDVYRSVSSPEEELKSHLTPLGNGFENEKKNLRVTSAKLDNDLRAWPVGVILSSQEQHHRIYDFELSTPRCREDWRTLGQVAVYKGEVVDAPLKDYLNVPRFRNDSK